MAVHIRSGRVGMAVYCHGWAAFFCNDFRHHYTIEHSRWRVTACVARSVSPYPIIIAALP